MIRHMLFNKITLTQEILRRNFTACLMKKYCNFTEMEYVEFHNLELSTKVDMTYGKIDRMADCRKMDIFIAHLVCLTTPAFLS